MPEVGLEIGYERGNYAGVTREWLYWYDEAGRRYPTPNERVQLEVRRAAQLAQRLRELGVDSDSWS
jgi:hypothetical protein